MFRSMFLLALVLTVALAPVHAADLRDSLQTGTPELESAGPLAFGPEGILFLGDPLAATIYAIDTGDASGDPSAVELNVRGIQEKIAGLLGTTAREILINDLAINPASGNAYLSVSRGRGTDAQPVLLRVSSKGELSEVSLKNIRYSKAKIPNAIGKSETGRRRNRTMSITDLAYVDGRVFVAGLSNEEFDSRLRSIPFPFSSVDSGTSVGIFHGAHGRFETKSPIRTFAPYEIDGAAHLLAAYTCTPLVKFPVADLKPGAEIKGTTIAELGNGNRPLDMIVYEKEGNNYILLTNSRRGVMKITTEGIGTIEGINKRISGTAGASYDTIAELKGVVQLDRLNDRSAVVLVTTESGDADLQTVALP